MTMDREPKRSVDNFHPQRQSRAMSMPAAKGSAFLVHQCFPRQKHTQSRNLTPQESPGFAPRGHFFGVSLGLLRQDRLRWGFQQERSELVVTPFICAAAHSGKPEHHVHVQTASSFTKSTVVFAPYLRVRLIAPLLAPIVFLRDRLSSSKVSAHQRITVTHRLKKNHWVFDNSIFSSSTMRHYI